MRDVKEEEVVNRITKMAAKLHFSGDQSSILGMKVSADVTNWGTWMTTKRSWPPSLPRWTKTFSIPYKQNKLLLLYSCVLFNNQSCEHMFGHSPIKFFGLPAFWFSQMSWSSYHGSRGSRFQGPGGGHRALEEGQFRKKIFALKSIFLDTNRKFRYVGSWLSAFSPPFCEFFHRFLVFVRGKCPKFSFLRNFQKLSIFHTKCCLKAQFWVLLIHWQLQ